MRRMSSYPSLEYQNLYNAICMLVSFVDKSFESSLILILISLKIDVAPNIQYGIQSEFLINLLIAALIK